MSATADQRDEALMFAGVAILWVMGSMALIGPVALTIAAITMTGTIIAGCQIVGALVVIGVGAAVGILLWGADAWLLGPLQTMVDIYRDFLFDGHRFDFDGLITLFGRMLLNGSAWPYFAPVGVVAGGLYWIIWQVCTGNPIERSARAKSKRRPFASLMTRWGRQRLNHAAADTADGSRIGIDKKSGKGIDLADVDANKHALVLGTIGSGKTVSVLNMVESAINRELPVVYVDGKGDYDLARQVMAYAEDRGRPIYLFAMNGESCAYNPLASGGYSAKKDRIVELREWSEDHYRKLAEGYLQLVFKVLDTCGVETDLVSVAEYMSLGNLKALIQKQGKGFAAAGRLLEAIKKRKPAEEHVESLREEVWTLAESEIGHLFDTASVSECSPILELLPAIEEHAVVYFCLPALEFPALAKLVGKLVINDLKSAAAAQLIKPKAKRLPFYTIFDEFSVFAGEQVLNLINMGRGAGVHAVLATQSVADIGRAVTNGPDHFIRQVFSSCNSYLIHRLNAAEDVTTIVETIGTVDAVEHTAQVDLLGATGMGSARQTKAFVIHPDEIKHLGRGEAMFVNKNRNLVKPILVRHSAIDRIE